MVHANSRPGQLKNKPFFKGQWILAQPVIHRETMTTERTEKSDRKGKLSTIESKLTLLFVSRGGSWGFRQACATLITCSSFRGCSSTFAAKNKVVGDIIYTENKTFQRILLTRDTRLQFNRGFSRRIIRPEVTILEVLHITAQALK